LQTRNGGKNNTAHFWTKLLKYGQNSKMKLMSPCYHVWYFSR
jgi:hypothetical protein